MTVSLRSNIKSWRPENDGWGFNARCEVPRVALQCKHVCCRMDRHYDWSRRLVLDGVHHEKQLSMPAQME